MSYRLSCSIVHELVCNAGGGQRWKAQCRGIYDGSSVVDQIFPREVGTENDCYNRETNRIPTWVSQFDVPSLF